MQVLHQSRNTHRSVYVYVHIQLLLHLIAKGQFTQSKSGSESEKDQRTIKKIKRISNKHQRKVSIFLSLGVNGPLWLWRKESGTYFFELFTDHCEGFEDGVDGTGHGDDSLGTRRVRDIDFGTALKMENNRLSKNIPNYYRFAKMCGMMSSCCANIDVANKFGC